MTAPINTTLSDVFRSTPGGDPRSAIGDAFYGINQRQIPGAMPVNHDQHGLTFFTRPQLNLQTSNVLVSRTMVPLLTEESASVQRMVRKALDPRIDLACPIFDSRSAFIPVLSNLLLRLNGWPDPAVETYTSKPGMAGEELSMVDGHIDNKSAYTLTATFRNVLGNPIGLIHDAWLEYASRVFIGQMLPYPDFIAMNEIDYNTRIYRLVLDRTRRFVQSIACCGAAFPISTTTGQTFNYERDQPRNSSNDEMQISFRANGWYYNDYMAVMNFNNVVGVFNPDMREYRYKDAMVQIPHDLMDSFRSRGYPRIDPNTLELQWWVSQGEYSSRMAALDRHNQALGTSLPYLQSQ